MRISCQTVIRAAVGLTAALLIGANLWSPRLPAAGAATNATVIAGGSTLAAKSYVGQPLGMGATSFGAAGSVFGYLATISGGANVQYCATGSGRSKAIFTSGAGTDNTPCANAASSTAQSVGFLPPAGSPTQTYPTLAASDIPLSQAEYNAYLANHPNFEPVELLAMFGSIAIVYHDAALGQSHPRIAITNDQLCQIFRGQLRTFGQLLGTADSTPIVPVYRSDGSGTSFSFSNHLASAPNSANCAAYGANEDFTVADPANIASFGVGANGDSTILGEVNSINGAIGYVSTGYLTNAPTGVGEVNYADIINPVSGAAIDPFAGVPAAANAVPESAVKSDVAITQTVAGQGPATVSPLSGVPYQSCVRVVPPAAYARPSTGYPILAATYLLFNNISAAEVSPLRALIKILTTPNLFKRPDETTPITTVDQAEPATTVGTTGYSSLGSTFSTELQATANRCLAPQFSTPYPSPTPVPSLQPATPPPIVTTPTPAPAPTYTTAPTPIQSPSVVPATPAPVRDVFSISGSSTDTYGLCPASSPESWSSGMGNWYSAPFVATPTTPATAIAGSFNNPGLPALPSWASWVTFNASPLTVTLYRGTIASGTLLTQSIIAGGSTGIFTYYAGDAPAATYYVEVSGGLQQFGTPCPPGLNTYEDTVAQTWTGTAVYSP